MWTTPIKRRETVISIEGDRPLSDYAGQPYLFVTYEGDTIEGVTEVDGYRLIVRFADGRWAYASTQWAE
jgi:hypothetical protein